MFRKVALIGVAIAVVLALGAAGVWLWGLATSPAAAQSAEPVSDYNPAETITVVGQGTTTASPDIAKVSLGVDTTAETISEAVEENDSIMASILAALKEAGIADKDIQTMNYSITLDRYPEPYAEEGAASEAKPMYRVSNMVSVTIRDLDSVGDVLDAVIEAGANDIWGITFALDDLSAAREEARANAIEDALARAKALAELSGVELGPVMSVTEVIGSTPLQVPVAFESAAAGAGSISPGELEIGYQVQVAYFIER